MKAFCIYLKHIEESVRLAQRCVSSGRSHSLHVELHDGVDGDKAYELFRAAGVPLTINPDAHNANERVGKMTKGQMGCIGSHYTLWTNCIALNEPIIVLEHDATIVSKIEEVEFNEVLNLQSNTWDNPNWAYYKKIQKLFRDPCVNAPEEGIQSAKYINLPGTSGYALTPTGAKKLVAGIKTRGPYLADLFINKSLVEIQDLWPRPVVTLHGVSTVVPNRKYNPPT